MFSPPNATYSEDLYRFHWPEMGVECIVEGITAEKTDIRVEITVNLSHGIYGGRLYTGHLLLMGTNSRRDVRKALEDRVPSDEFDWGAILEQICLLTRERYRRGEPVIDLAMVDYRSAVSFLLKPFVPDRAISILYGDGGTAKSLFALAMGVCISTCTELVGMLPERAGRILYLDWEDDAETHAERLNAVCKGMDLDLPEGMILYQRRAERLQESTREIRRTIVEKDIVLVIVDSLGMAAGNPMDEALMLGALRAARSFNCAVLMIHHLPKDPKDKSKPFGTVYASNEARMTWLVEASEDEPSSALSTLYTNYKWNRGRKFGRRAMVARFETTDEDVLTNVTFQDSDIRLIDAFRSKLPLPQLMVKILEDYLAVRPPESPPTLTVDEMHQRLIGEKRDHSLQVVRNAFTGKRGKELFVRFGAGYTLLSQHSKTESNNVYTSDKPSLYA